MILMLVSSATAIHKWNNLWNERTLINMENPKSWILPFILSIQEDNIQIVWVYVYLIWLERSNQVSIWIEEYHIENWEDRKKLGWLRRQRKKILKDGNNKLVSYFWQLQRCVCEATKNWAWIEEQFTFYVEKTLSKAFERVLCKRIVLALVKHSYGPLEGSHGYFEISAVKPLVKLSHDLGNFLCCNEEKLTPSAWNSCCFSSREEAR